MVRGQRVADSRDLFRPVISSEAKRSREISCTQKFPIELKRSGSKPDRKPLAKSFLLR